MTLRIDDLTSTQATELSEMLLSGRPEYSQLFLPFSFKADDLAVRLEAAQRDRYWGIRWQGELVGLFMLRGFDQGYERPSFGVYIAEPFAHRGLATLALSYAMSWCRLHDIPAMMLKVHRANRYARRIYDQAGFKFVEVCPNVGHDILEKRWR